MQYTCLSLTLSLLNVDNLDYSILQLPVTKTHFTYTSRKYDENKKFIIDS